MSWLVDPPPPEELQIEVTGACNLRCRMCLVRYRPRLDRHTASMDSTRFAALLDELPGLRRLTLQGLGEPLLAPDFFDIIDAARSRGIEVGFNTNATLLSRRTCERLVAAGVEWIHVSVDGATAPTFEHVRDGARYDRVLRNLRTLLDVKRESASRRPHVQVNVVAMRSNVAELPQIVHLASRAGVQRCWIQNLSHDFSDTNAPEYEEMRSFVAAEALSVGCPDVARILDVCRDIASADGIDLRLPGDGWNGRRRARDEPACDWPWRSAYITHDGHVQPCCMVMGSDRATLGDLTAETFTEVWHSDTYVGFRKALFADDEHAPAVCRGCSVYRNTF
jgi:radical SAM protein with 4Fe4S-binding SPASM domain